MTICGLQQNYLASLIAPHMGRFIHAPDFHTVWHLATWANGERPICAKKHR